MEISEKLKEHRKKAGYTQEKLAQNLNVSRQTVSNWENAKSLPDIYSLVALSDLYGISLDDFIKGDVQMMKSIKKEKNEKNLLNRAIILSCAGALLLIVSYLLPSSNLQAFISGLSTGLLLVGGVATIVVKTMAKMMQGQR